MFENRLKLLLIIFAVPAAALGLRLLQLQVVFGSHGAEQARELLWRSPRYFPCLRGSVTDREGALLAYDAPSWDITLEYGVMTRDPVYLRGIARQLYRDLEPDEARLELEEQIENSFAVLTQLTGEPRSYFDELMERRVRRVQGVRQSVARRRGVDGPVAEEEMGHSLVSDLSQEEQVAARIALKEYPWLKVARSHARRYEGGPAMTTILGHMAELETLDNDPHADDPLERYELGERRGVSGVERMAEASLRGRRGRIHEDRAGKPLQPPIDPIDGQDFRISIDLKLQQKLYNQLAAAVEQTTHRSGGCAIVVHVPTREVLAMVSYPMVDPEDESFDALNLTEEDLMREPHVFRPIRSYYPPGSIVKPMLMAGALTDRVVGPTELITCNGRLNPELPFWACTGTHGPIECVTSIRQSCNVFYYHLGERLGVERMHFWMSQFGLGRLTGMGLIGEKAGNLPEHGSKSQARNIAIGQGSFDVTPAQAANMLATVAAGVYRTLTLCADDPAPRPETRLAIPQENWRLVREGMYQSVNVPGGTAHGQHGAKFVGADDYVLLGKTGSAQAPPRPVEWIYTCHFPDGRVEEVVARSPSEAQARYPESKIEGWRSYRRWPSGDSIPTHAWFAGYLAPKGDYLAPLTDGDLSVGIVLILEYSGHGGAVAAPVAKQMMQSVILRHRQDSQASAHHQHEAQVSADAGGRP